MSLAERLHPSNFTAMSPKMAAIVGYILDQEWTIPAIEDIAITTDGHAIAGVHGYIGTATEMKRNIADLLDAASLTADERGEWKKRYGMRVADWQDDEIKE